MYRNEFMNQYLSLPEQLRFRYNTKHSKGDNCSAYLWMCTKFMFSSTPEGKRYWRDIALRIPR